MLPSIHSHPLQSSDHIRHCVGCASIRVIAVAICIARASYPLVGICFCAAAPSITPDSLRREDFLYPVRAGASSMRTKSAFFAAASSLPPLPPLQGDRPHGHKGAVGASKKMGPPGGGHLPRCLATPRNGGFFRIKSRGQTDKQLRYARRIGTGDTVPSGDASRKLYGASPRGGQDVR